MFPYILNIYVCLQSCYCLGDESAAATAIVSVDAATGSAHAHLLISGLLLQPNAVNDISNKKPLDVSSIQSPSNNGNIAVVTPTYPLEVKFESNDEVTGETRIIVEDLTLPSIDNVSYEKEKLRTSNILYNIS